MKIDIFKHNYSIILHYLITVTIQGRRSPVSLGLTAYSSEFDLSSPAKLSR